MERAGEAQASQQCYLGSNPYIFFGFYSLLLVLFSDFSPGTPIFPSRQITKFTNCNSTRYSKRRTAKWMDHNFCFKFYLFYLVTTYMDSIRVNLIL